MYVQGGKEDAFGLGLDQSLSFGSCCAAKVAPRH